MVQPNGIGACQEMLGLYTKSEYRLKSNSANGETKGHCQQPKYEHHRELYRKKFSCFYNN